MIRIRYIHQVGLIGHRISYTWAGRVLTATLYRSNPYQGNEVVGQETYDLSALQPGDEVVGVEPEVLPFPLLISARCLDGETLEVVLVQWYEGVEPPELGEEVLDG